jgi:hypothetical protein
MDLYIPVESNQNLTIKNERTNLISTGGTESRGFGMHIYSKEYGEIPFIYKIIVFIVLSISMSSMGSCIVIESINFPKQQLALVLLYTLLFDLCFMIILLINNYKMLDFIRILKDKRLISIGIWWSINYVFILISAPYIPNIVQVILAQSQIILIYVIDISKLGISTTPVKILMVLLNVMGNLLVIIDNSNNSPYNKFTSIFWSIIFLLNAWAGGLGNLYAEALMKIENPIDNNMRLIEINFGSNFHSFFISFLGIKLAYLANGSLTPVFDLSQLNINILYWLGMTLSSVIYTLISYYIVWKQSAIFNGMASVIGSTLQAILFNFNFMGKYQDKITTVKLISLIVVTISSLIYIITPDKRDMNKLKSSFLGSLMNNNDDGSFWKHITILLFIYFMIYSIGTMNELETTK